MHVHHRSDDDFIDVIPDAFDVVPSQLRSARAIVVGETLAAAAWASRATCLPRSVPSPASGQVRVAES